MGFTWSFDSTPVSSGGSTTANCAVLGMSANAARTKSSLMPTESAVARAPPSSFRPTAAARAEPSVWKADGTRTRNVSAATVASTAPAANGNAVGRRRRRRTEGSYFRHLKILVLTTSYPRGPEDASGRFVADAVEAARARGFEVEVVS